MSGMSSQGSGQRIKPGGRETFGTFELSIVMSHYDVGSLEAVQEFPRGSRRAPKLILRTDTGMYLLKRRQPKDDPNKVVFCHNLQLYLASKQFPLPHLIGTRRENNSMLQWEGRIYELFEYIKGSMYDASPEATQDSGKILALFHKLLNDYKPDFDTPKNSYHGNPHVHASMELAPRTLLKTNPDNANRTDEIDDMVEFIKAAYAEGAEHAIELGLLDWPTQIVHHDWHSGNMLFRGPRVVAVIDYDTARIMQRVIDVANGALQFSILGGSGEPSTWPENIDEIRYKRFLKGYDSVPGCMLSKVELQAIPWLMIETLIAEAAIPIGTTGFLGSSDGLDVLKMIRRKVTWLQQNADRLGNVLED